MPKRPEHFSQPSTANELRVNRMVADIAERFLGEATHEENLHFACRTLGETLAVSRAYIFENFADNTRCCNTVEWVKEGVEAVRDQLQDVPYDSIPYWKISLEKGDTIVANDIRTLPPDVYALLEWQGIDSLLVVPLTGNEGWLGFLGLDVCDGLRNWEEWDVAALRTVARLVVKLLERRKVEQHMSHSWRLSAVGSLAAGVAHEYNNLHAGIMGLVELVLESGHVHGQSRNDLERVLGLLDRGIDLTRRLLSISRKKSERDRVDMRALVADCLAILERPLSAAGIVSSLTNEARFFFVIGNSGELNQVLLNLLLNARDALNDSPHRRLRVRIRNSVDMTRLLIDVEDTGPGIPEYAMERLFEPFYTLTGKLGGGTRESTGLGLTISQRIASEHKGAIRVRNQPHGGACFTLELPTARPEDEDRPFEDELTPPPRMLGRIGIVDDEPAILDVLARFLGGLGHYVETFPDDLAAQEALGKRSFDVFLVDLVQPNRGGLRMLEYLVTMPPETRPEVVVVSGKEPEQVRRQLAGFPFRHLLPKPFVNLESVDELIQQLLTTTA